MTPVRPELPRLAEWLLRRLSRAGDRLPMEGDFNEEFDWRVRTQGTARARRWYWAHLLESGPALVSNAFYWRLAMFKNYWTIAWRNILKHKTYAFIKTFGLTAGIGCCLLAYLHIKTELSYDDFHEHAGTTFRVIRVGTNLEDHKVRFRDPSLAPHMGSLLSPYFPEIQNQTRYAEILSGIVAAEDRLFQETLPMADASFFEIFSFPLLAGDPKSVLSKDDHVVLTQSCARKYFGRMDPVGRRLTITYGNAKKDFTVSGVAADPPKNSIFQFGLILPIGNLPAFMNRPGFLTEWSDGVWQIPIYVQLKPGVRAADLEKRFPAFASQYFDRDIARTRPQGWVLSFGLQNIRDVYLDSSVYQGKGLSETLVLSGIVFLILVMAGMNFTNLSLGTASFRAKEIGIRKVIGAERRQLIRQFWGEALITVGGAALAGIGLAILLLPMFNQLVGKSYTSTDFLSFSNVFALIVLVVITGSLTAAYPALVMASFRPVEIIRGKFRFSGKKALSKALVVFQFALSAILIISALTFQKQMRVLNKRDLGYSRDGLLAVRTQENEPASSRGLIALYRERILRNPRVLGVTASSAPFGLSPAPRTDTDRIDVHWNGVDPDFLRTINAKVVAGEDFHSDGSGNTGTALVNESFVRAFGVASPVGMTIGEAVTIHEPGYDIAQALRGLVIRGVAKDFQFAPMSFGIFPAIFHVQPTVVYSRMLVRVSTGSLPETLKFLELQWRDIRPDKPFLYYFQDDALARLLQAERRWTQMTGWCSALAILLAAMGIFGLTSMSMNSRVKDIGIRKTFGASTGRIVGDAYRSLLGPIAVAIGLAWPAAFFLLQKALQRFPYQIKIPAADFVLGGLFTLAIAVATTLVLVLKTAKASPVESIHRE
jgi:putative ABC transport system permease protein